MRDEVKHAIIGRNAGPFQTANEAQVIEMKLSTAGGWVVFCYAPWANDPYVTWSMDNNRACYTGHYFPTFADAKVDYEKRAY